MDANALAQRLRAIGGQSLENVVAHILNELMSPDIVVVPGRRNEMVRLLGDREAADRIIDYLRLPVKRRCTQSQIQDYPDSDLIALIPPSDNNGQWRVLAIISCKASLRERYLETCFWGAAIRSSSYIKYVFVTMDKDVYNGKVSELGTSCVHSRAARRLLECFTDRVYLVQNYAGVDDPRLIQDLTLSRAQSNSASTVLFDSPLQPGHTEYCHLIRPLDDLIGDLRRWIVDVPPP